MLRLLRKFSTVAHIRTWKHLHAFEPVISENCEPEWTLLELRTLVMDQAVEGASSGPLESSSGPLESSSGPLESSSGPLDSSSGHLDSSSGHLDPSSGHVLEGVDHALKEGEVESLEYPLIGGLAGLESNLIQELHTLAQPICESRQVGKSVMRHVIGELCNKRYLTLSVLGVLLERNTDYLRKHYLNPMVQENRLRRAFPKSPNDPRQAYNLIKGNP